MTTRVDDRLEWAEMSVLVTGGTGFFGNKSVEIMQEKHQSKRLVIFSRDELKLT